MHIQSESKSDLQLAVEKIIKSGLHIDCMDMRYHMYGKYLLYYTAFFKFVK